MFEQLYKSINEKVSLTEDEFALCKTFFIPKKLRKKQILLQEGSICIYNAFIEKGILRSYTVDEKGNEHIVQFGFEGWWVSDLSSFLTNSISNCTIEALEDSELLLLTTEARDAMMQKIPMFERYQRILLENAYIAMQKRITAALTATAEEKYLNLLAVCPNILIRIPQHMIASYLGITAETLSRIRKHLHLKK